MKNAITVSQLNRFIKDMFTQNQLLYTVMVKGEISNFKESRGNYYFSLKDENSSIQAIIFQNNNSIDVRNIKDGMQVIAYGRVAVYEKNGTYAIYVNKIENAGLGEYYIKLEELKKKLADMGMFDESYKKPIPKYSMKIGVVTARTGAAIHDIETTIKNKNPYAKIFLYPAVVQGENAYQTIIDGIMTLDKMNLDNIIIGRGGGSIEDLYSFNDERVAYAIFNAKTPIISAVGHEINDSISDLVADVRVATPTAAGELATFSYVEFLEDIENYYENIRNVMFDKINTIKEKIEISKRQIDLLAPTQKLYRYVDSIKYKRETLNKIINSKLSNSKNKIVMYIEMLKNRDVLDKLGKGLAYVSDEKNKKIVSIKSVEKNSIVNLRLKDGKIETKVSKIIKI